METTSRSRRRRGATAVGGGLSALLHVGVLLTVCGSRPAASPDDQSVMVGIGDREPAATPELAAATAPAPAPVPPVTPPRVEVRSPRPQRFFVAAGVRSAPGITTKIATIEAPAHDARS